MLLLNNDVVVDPGFLAPLLRAMGEVQEAARAIRALRRNVHPPAYVERTYGRWFTLAATSFDPSRYDQACFVLKRNAG